MLEGRARPAALRSERLDRREGGGGVKKRKRGKEEKLGNVYALGLTGFHFCG